jgi:hypothetical protein
VSFTISTVINHAPRGIISDHNIFIAQATNLTTLEASVVISSNKLMIAIMFMGEATLLTAEPTDLESFSGFWF